MNWAWTEMSKEDADLIWALCKETFDDLEFIMGKWYAHETYQPKGRIWDVHWPWRWPNTMPEKLEIVVNLTKTHLIMYDPTKTANCSSPRARHFDVGDPRARAGMLICVLTLWKERLNGLKDAARYGRNQPQHALRDDQTPGEAPRPPE